MITRKFVVIDGGGNKESITFNRNLNYKNKIRKLGNTILKCSIFE